jgi:hypothetical protein
MLTAFPHSAPFYIGLISLLGGCATPEQATPLVTWGPVRTYSGSYVPGWEFSDFTPTGSTETWWLSGNLKPIYPYEEGYYPHGVHLSITVEGQLSSPGHYGHLGRFPRELRVMRVVSIRRQRKASNQALERTADRRENLLSMTSTLKPEARLALVSGRSSWSR